MSSTAGLEKQIVVSDTSNVSTMNDNMAVSIPNAGGSDDDLDNSSEDDSNDDSDDDPDDNSDHDMEMEDVSRTKLLEDAQKSKVELVQSRIRNPVPKDVRTIHRELFPIAQRWWSSADVKMKQEDKTKIENANNRLREIGKNLDPKEELAFNFPGQELHLHIRTMVDLMAKRSDDKKLAAVIVLTMAILEGKGIHWNDIVEKNHSKSLLDQAALIKDSTVTKYVEGATPEQYAVLKQAPIKQIVSLVKNRAVPSDDEKKEIIAIVRRCNVDLEQINRQNRFALKDNLLPLKKIEKLLDATQKPAKSEKLYFEIDKKMDFSRYTDAPPPYEAANDSGPIPVTKSKSPDDPPRFVPFAATVPVAEEFGRIIHVRSAGRAGTRVVIQRGTNAHPVYQYVSGSLFTKEAVEEASSRQKPDDMKPPTLSKNSKPTIVLFVELPKTNVDSKRKELGLFGILVSENGSDKLQFATRSHMSVTCGKKWTEDLIGKMRENAAQNEEYLAWHKQRNLHPDTHKPLSLADKENMPWLVQGASVPYQITAAAEPVDRYRQWLLAQGNGSY